MKTSLLFVVLSLALLQFACTREKGPSASTSTESKYTMTDTDLRHRVESSLNSDSDLAAAKIRVDANAERNTAKLSGTVESESLRIKAVDLAQGSNPGIVIEDHIVVRPSVLSREDYTEEHARVERGKAKQAHESIGTSIDDAWIHAKVVAKLIADTGTAARNINVDVNNNVVTLRGSVGSMDEKAEVQRLATDTNGVKRVINQLHVVSKKAS